MDNILKDAKNITRIEHIFRHCHGSGREDDSKCQVDEEKWNTERGRLGDLYNETGQLEKITELNSVSTFGQRYLNGKKVRAKFIRDVYLESRSKGIWLTCQFPQLEYVLLFLLLCVDIHGLKY
ncbi:hypothetical protein J6590_085249 [Homalodisca vitripennis]|nr:hypothetical protein J6590_085249 [Homalodisca vitripennis]